MESYVCLLLVQLAVSVPLYALCATPALLLLADVVVDMTMIGEFSHRCKLLEHEHSTVFLVASHILANAYVLVLETGRLYGHLKRGHLGSVCRRFDWHCGRLANSCEVFQRREFYKFLGFAAVGFASLLFSK